MHDLGELKHAMTTAMFPLSGGFRVACRWAALTSTRLPSGIRFSMHLGIKTTSPI